MDLWFVLLHISTLFIIFLLVHILRIHNKEPLHIVFSLVMLCILIWSAGRLLEKYFDVFTATTITAFVYVSFIGIIFLPLCLLLLGMIIVGKKINWKYWILGIPQAVSVLLLLTNEYHKLFILKYSEFNANAVYGSYFYAHSIISYIYIGIGLYSLIYFSVRNSGFFSRQTLIVLLGISVSLAVNICSTLKLIELPYTSTPVSFSFAVACFYISIVKFDFFNLIPLAMQNIVNEISDCFIVVNPECKIIDYNEPFEKVFGSIMNIKRNIFLSNIKTNYESALTYAQMLGGFVERSNTHKNTFFTEEHIKVEDFFDKFFSIEVTPIIKEDVNKGTIMLFKDVTELKNTQNQLIAKEKLASLGQLTGGIAHSLKTPISSMGDSIEILDNYINEYKESIDNELVTKKDHHEIAQDMKNSLSEMKIVVKYMSDVINTVKNYSTDAVTSSGHFTIKDLKDTIYVLLNHELKRHNCKLNFNSNVSDTIVINGDLRNMIQVINVLISNAIEAYHNSANGIVDLLVSHDGQNIIISVKDYGSGIPPEIQKKLFNKMCTTKGNKGTGIGLYVSKNIIEGQFNGKLTFQSKENEGSTFYITIPTKKIQKKGV